jgi:hypothetical protein
MHIYCNNFIIIGYNNTQTCRNPPTRFGIFRSSIGRYSEYFPEDGRNSARVRMYADFECWFIDPKTCSFLCFVWVSEQTAIISLYNINWLVCITEMECVYCAVRTGSLNLIQVLRFITYITYSNATKYPAFRKNGSPVQHFWSPAQIAYY